MTYRELLETMKKSPNYFWSSEQWDKQSEERYRTWARHKHRSGGKKKSTGKG